MKFFNNIYASVYRCYDRYERSPRYKAASFIFLCMLGFFGVLVATIKKIFSLDLVGIKNFSGYKILFVVIGFSFLGLLWKYYSKDKVDNIISVFVEKKLSERRMWGFIAVFTFVFSWAIFALLLSK